MTRVIARPLGAALLMVTAACGGAAQVSDDPATPTATPTTSPSMAATSSPSADPTATADATAEATPDATATPAGEAELAVDWAVPFTITVPSDWSIEEGDTPTAVDIVDGTGLRYVLAALLKSPDAPDVWVERLTTNEVVAAGAEPQAVNVDGAEGFMFDVVLNDDAPPCVVGGSALGGTCLPFHTDGEYVWLLEEGRQARFWALDVDGETVLLFTDAREDRFESWGTMMDEVLSTLEWGQP